MPDLVDRPRVSHVAGETLRARDLAADLARTDELWRAHVVLTHGVWGVAEGLVVTLPAPAGPVMVSPGVAVDVLGRTLVVDQPAAVPLPAADTAGSRWRDLLLSSDEGLGGAPGSPRPRLWWSSAPAAPAGQPPAATPADQPAAAGIGSDVRPGLDIPLGRVVVAAGDPVTAVGGVDTSTRRFAHGRRRPRVVADQLLAGTAPVVGRVGAWTIDVDTSAAGFATVPYYVASLGADPLATTAGPLTIDPRIVGPYMAILSRSVAGFRLLVWYGWPDAVPDRPPELVPELSALPVPLSWVGVEPRRDGQPGDGQPGGGQAVSMGSAA